MICMLCTIARAYKKRVCPYILFHFFNLSLPLWGTMLTVGTIVSLGYYIAAVVFLRGLYIMLSRFWWGERGSKPMVRYKEGSSVCEAIVQSCSTLRESYSPPLLWGKNGHLQTIMFGMIGRFRVPQPQITRHRIPAPDGSTVIYDLCEPDVPTSYTYIVCPGIGSTSESDYIRAFMHYAVNSGFRVAVVNHVGGLRDTDITGKRLFTYGGTGDMAVMFEDLLVRYPNNQFIPVGFSLGANIIVRFVGEREEWRSRFVCAVSVCQGYDANSALTLLRELHDSQIHRLYSKNILTKQLKLLRRHRNSLFGEETQQHLKDTTRRHSDVTHSGYDCNGFALDPDKISHPDEERLWSAKNMEELDEYYTRRVMGFDSLKDMYKWTSCVDLMQKVTDFPLLLVNASDDPVVPQALHSIPIEYTDQNPYAMFVLTEHGGHLGFFEGGFIRANPVCWVDRLIVEYTRACIELLPEHKQS